MLKFIKYLAVGGIALLLLLAWLFYGTPLHYAASKNNVWLTGALVSLGHPMEAKHRSPTGVVPTTALVWAAESGAKNTATLLLERGAEPVGGVGALAMAARNGHAEIVDNLLAHRANPNDSGRGRSPAIFWAINGRGSQEGSSETQCAIMDRLIEAGSFVEIRRQPNEKQMKTRVRDTSTPLYEAASLPRPCAVKLLLDYGVNREMKVFGRSAADMVRERIAEGKEPLAAYKKVLELLENYRPKATRDHPAKRQLLR